MAGDGSPTRDSDDTDVEAEDTGRGVGTFSTGTGTDARTATGTRTGPEVHDDGGEEQKDTYPPLVRPRGRARARVRTMSDDKLSELADQPLFGAEGTTASLPGEESDVDFSTIRMACTRLQGLVDSTIHRFSVNAADAHGRLVDCAQRAENKIRSSVLRATEEVNAADGVILQDLNSQLSRHLINMKNDMYAVLEKSIAEIETGFHTLSDEVTQEFDHSMGEQVGQANKQLRYMKRDFRKNVEISRDAAKTRLQQREVLERNLHEQAQKRLRDQIQSQYEDTIREQAAEIKTLKVLNGEANDRIKVCEREVAAVARALETADAQLTKQEGALREMFRSLHIPVAMDPPGFRAHSLMGNETGGPNDPASSAPATARASRRSSRSGGAGKSRKQKGRRGTTRKVANPRDVTPTSVANEIAANRLARTDGEAILDGIKQVCASMSSSVSRAEQLMKEKEDSCVARDMARHELTLSHEREMALKGDVQKLRIQVARARNDQRPQRTDTQEDMPAQHTQEPQQPPETQHDEDEDQQPQPQPLGEESEEFTMPATAEEEAQLQPAVNEAPKHADGSAIPTADKDAELDAAQAQDPSTSPRDTSASATNADSADAHQPAHTPPQDQEQPEQAAATQAERPDSVPSQSEPEAVDVTAAATAAVPPQQLQECSDVERSGSPTLLVVTQSEAEDGNKSATDTGSSRKAGTGGRRGRGKLRSGKLTPTRGGRTPPLRTDSLGSAGEASDSGSAGGRGGGKRGKKRGRSGSGTGRNLTNTVPSATSANSGEGRSSQPSQPSAVSNETPVSAKRTALSPPPTPLRPPLRMGSHESVHSSGASDVDKSTQGQQSSNASGAEKKATFSDAGANDSLVANTHSLADHYLAAPQDAHEQQAGTGSNLQPSPIKRPRNSGGAAKASRPSTANSTVDKEEDEEEEEEGGQQQISKVRRPQQSQQEPHQQQQQQQQQPQPRGVRAGKRHGEDGDEDDASALSGKKPSRVRSVSAATPLSASRRGKGDMDAGDQDDGIAPSRSRKQRPARSAGPTRPARQSTPESEEEAPSRPPSAKTQRAEQKRLQTHVASSLDSMDSPPARGPEVDAVGSGGKMSTMVSTARSVSSGDELPPASAAGGRQSKQLRQRVQTRDSDQDDSPVQSARSNKASGVMVGMTTSSRRRGQQSSDTFEDGAHTESATPGKSRRAERADNAPDHPRLGQQRGGRPSSGNGSGMLQLDAAESNEEDEDDFHDVATPYRPPSASNQLHAMAGMHRVGHDLGSDSLSSDLAAGRMQSHSLATESPPISRTPSPDQRAAPRPYTGSEAQGAAQGQPPSVSPVSMDSDGGGKPGGGESRPRTAPAAAGKRNQSAKPVSSRPERVRRRGQRPASRAQSPSPSPLRDNGEEDNQGYRYPYIESTDKNQQIMLVHDDDANGSGEEDDGMVSHTMHERIDAVIQEQLSVPAPMNDLSPAVQVPHIASPLVDSPGGSLGENSEHGRGGGAQLAAGGGGSIGAGSPIPSHARTMAFRTAAEAFVRESSERDAHGEGSKLSLEQLRQLVHHMLQERYQLETQIAKQRSKRKRLAAVAELRLAEKDVLVTQLANKVKTLRQRLRRYITTGVRDAEAAAQQLKAASGPHRNRKAITPAQVTLRLSLEDMDRAVQAAAAAAGGPGAGAGQASTVDVRDYGFSSDAELKAMCGNWASNRRRGDGGIAAGNVRLFPAGDHQDRVRAQAARQRQANTFLQDGSGDNLAKMPTEIHIPSARHTAGVNLRQRGGPGDGGGGANRIRTSSNSELSAGGRSAMSMAASAASAALSASSASFTGEGPHPSPELSSAMHPVTSAYFEQIVQGGLRDMVHHRPGSPSEITGSSSVPATAGGAGTATSGSDAGTLRAGRKRAQQAAVDALEAVATRM